MTFNLNMLCHDQGRKSSPKTMRRGEVEIVDNGRRSKTGTPTFRIPLIRRRLDNRNNIDKIYTPPPGDFLFKSQPVANRYYTPQPGRHPAPIKIPQIQINGTNESLSSLDMSITSLDAPVSPDVLQSAPNLRLASSETSLANSNPRCKQEQALNFRWENWVQ